MIRKPDPVTGAAKQSLQRGGLRLWSSRDSSVVTGDVRFWEYGHASRTVFRPTSDGSFGRSADTWRPPEADRASVDAKSEILPRADFRSLIY